MTLLELLFGWRLDQQYKHEKDNGWAINEINSMSQYAFLQELSTALERILDKKE